MKKRKLPKQFIKKKLKTFFIKNKLRLFFIRTKLEKRSLLHFILTSIKNNKKLQKHLIINVILTFIITVFVLYLMKNNNIELNQLLRLNYLVIITLCSCINTHVYFQIKEYYELSSMKWWLTTSSIYLIICAIVWCILWYIFQLFNINSYTIILCILSIMTMVSYVMVLIIFAIKSFFSKEDDYTDGINTWKYDFIQLKFKEVNHKRKSYLIIIKRGLI